MSDQNALLALARALSPSDAPVAACWKLVTLAIGEGIFDAEDAREALTALRKGNSFAVNEVGFEAQADDAVVSVLGHSATCSKRTLIEAMEKLLAP